MNTLNIKDLKFSYKKKEILKGLDFSLSNGINAILGPNGAGKTTLMKILATINNNNSNSITLNGISYTETEKIREYIGYLPQNFVGYKQLTGREFLEFIFEVKELKIDKTLHINDIICKVDLKKFIDKKIKTYSGGILRRLGIAQALIGNPNFIIIDEPTVGLDPEQRILFRNLLSIIAEDKIILMSTHIVEDIEFCSNKLFILNEGRVIYQGDSNELIQKYLGKIFEIETDKNLFDVINKQSKIIDFKITDNKYKIKYFGNKIFEGSKVVSNISLEEAYICCLNNDCGY